MLSSAPRLTPFLLPLLVVCLLMATGCAKEEVAAPAAPQKLVKKVVKPGNPDGNGTFNTGNSVNGNSPITDDGDDMGDNERTSKPR